MSLLIGWRLGAGHWETMFEKLLCLGWIWQWKCLSKPSTWTTLLIFFCRRDFQMSRKKLFAFQVKKKFGEVTSQGSNWKLVNTISGQTGLETTMLQFTTHICVTQLSALCNIKEEHMASTLTPRPPLTEDCLMSTMEIYIGMRLYICIKYKNGVTYMIPPTSLISNINPYSLMI